MVKRGGRLEHSGVHQEPVRPSGSAIPRLEVSQIRQSETENRMMALRRVVSLTSAVALTSELVTTRGEKILATVQHVFPIPDFRRSAMIVIRR